MDPAPCGCVELIFPSETILAQMSLETTKTASCPHCLFFLSWNFYSRLFYPTTPHTTTVQQQKLEQVLIILNVQHVDTPSYHLKLSAGNSWNKRSETQCSAAGFLKLIGCMCLCAGVWVCVWGRGGEGAIKSQDWCTERFCHRTPDSGCSSSSDSENSNISICL